MRMACRRHFSVLGSLLVVLCCIAVGGCKPAQKPPPITPPGPGVQQPRPPLGGPVGREAGGMKLELTSSAFREGETIPAKYTGDGADISPPLEWSSPPEGTQELALIMDDPDAPSGTFTHWLLWGLRPDLDGLPEGVKKSETVGALDGARQGTNDFRKIGYGGPAPPPGRPHRYIFSLYALDTRLDLRPGARRGDLLRAMEGHILAQSKLTGLYGR